MQLLLLIIVDGGCWGCSSKHIVTWTIIQANENGKKGFLCFVALSRGIKVREDFSAALWGGEE